MCILPGSSNSFSKCLGIVHFELFCDIKSVAGKLKHLKTHTFSNGGLETSSLTVSNVRSEDFSF